MDTVGPEAMASCRLPGRKRMKINQNESAVAASRIGRRLKAASVPPTAMTTSAAIHLGPDAKLNRIPVRRHARMAGESKAQHNRGHQRHSMRKAGH